MKSYMITLLKRNENLYVALFQRHLEQPLQPKCKQTIYISPKLHN